MVVVVVVWPGQVDGHDRGSWSMARHRPQSDEQINHASIACVCVRARKLFKVFLLLHLLHHHRDGFVFSVVLVVIVVVLATIIGGACSLVFVVVRC